MKFNKKQLPFYAAIVQTIQYGFGGFLYFSWIGILVVGSMGALISFTTAYASSQINDIAKGRKFSSWVAMVGIMLLSPVIIGTSLFYSLSMIENPVWRGIVSAVWAILPDGATALAGFVAGKSLASEPQKPAKRPQSEKKSRSATAKTRSANVSCLYAGCDRKFATQNAANAHARSCAMRPTTLPVESKKETVKG